LGPRPVGRRSSLLRAAAPQHPGVRVLGAAGQLVCEPRLADAALAAEQEEATAPCLGVLERGAELRKLAVAADEDPGRPPPRAWGRGSRRPARRLERGVLAQNRLLELLQRLARLDPQLLDERPPRLAVDLERFSLAA